MANRRIVTRNLKVAEWREFTADRVEAALRAKARRAMVKNHMVNPYVQVYVSG